MNITRIKNFNLKFNKKIFFYNALGMIILLVITNFTVSYSMGNFEIPFIDRNPGDKVVIDYELKPRGDNTDITEEPTQPLTNVAAVINPDDLISDEDVQPNDAAEIDSGVTFELYSDEMKKQGFYISDGIYELYDEEKTNAVKNSYKAEVEKALADGGDSQYMPPEPLLYEYKFAQIEPEAEILKKRSISDNSTYVSRPAVEPFMDYIIIRDEDFGEILCEASGKIIMRGFESSGLEILKMRTHDQLNNTVFKNKNNGLYYIYDPHENDAGGQFLFREINFSEDLGDRGVPFMYPSHYGANGANNLDRFHSYTNNRWGYATTGTASQKIWSRYERTFNFSEDIGIAYLDSPARGNKLYFLNEEGTDLLKGEYYAPSKIAVSHLGYFYFDHGLTRAYLRERLGLAITEREVILEMKRDSNGMVYFKEFYVPEDYNIKAYSNGMILLEKDGFHGFMNHLGEWVAQPIYKYAQPFYEGVAVIGLGNGKRALIDTKGNLVIRFKYDYITNCTGGIIALYERNVGWTVLNKVKRKIDID